MSCLHDDLSAALFNVRRPAPFGSLRELFVFPSYFLQAISRLRARLLLRLSARLFSSVAPVLWVCEVLVVNHFIIPARVSLSSRTFSDVLGGPANATGMNKFRRVVRGCGSCVALAAFPHPARTDRASISRKCSSKGGRDHD
jgi:hypothetical protein